MIYYGYEFTDHGCHLKHYISKEEGTEFRAWYYSDFGWSPVLQKQFLILSQSTVFRFNGNSSLEIVLKNMVIVIWK